jgi:hypothetical protein
MRKYERITVRAMSRALMQCYSIETKKEPLSKGAGETGLKVVLSKRKRASRPGFAPPGGSN